MLSFLFLFPLFSMTSATGHIRLELTASDSFALQLRTNSSFQTFSMIMGNTRVLSFHPKTDQDSLEIAFSRRGSVQLSHVYEMKSAGEVTRQTFLLNEVVLLVSSFFECDAGYIGDNCQEKSTTSTTTTTTTTVPSTTTTMEVKTTTAMIPTPSPIINQPSSFTNIFICSTLIIVIVVLLILILIVFMALRPRQQHIYIQPQTPTKSCKIVVEDSGYQSPESIRYTANPTKSSLTITL